MWILRDTDRQDRIRLTGTVVLTVLGSVIDGVSTLALIPVVELLGVTPGSTSGTETLERLVDPIGLEPTLAVALGVFVALTVFRAALGATTRVVGTHMRLRLVDRLRLECLSSLLRAPWTFVLSRRRSDVVQVVTAEVNRVGMSIDVSVGLLAAVGSTIASVVVAFSLAPGPAALALALAALLAALTFPVVRSAQHLGRELGRANRRFAATVSDSVDAFKLVRSHRLEQRWLDELAADATRIRGLQQRHAVISASSGAAIDVGTMVGVVGVLVVWNQTFGTATAVGIVVLYAIVRVMRQIAGLQRSVQLLANLLPAYAELRGLTDAAEAAAATEGGFVASNADRLPPPTGDQPLVEFRNMSYRYPNASADALVSVDLDLPARRTTALVGPSGAGKTTLADVALGLLLPTGGEIRLCGADPQVDPPALARWQTSTAYVPQEPLVLPTSLRHNLTWLAPDSADDDCWRALDEVGADFAHSLTDGLDTLIGDRGLRLSGGERQRLAIARALLRDPLFLVLDEATSALDDEREAVAQAALDRLHGRVTVLVIAHRLRTIRRADQVAVLDGGRLVENGPYDDLANDRTSRFRAMLERHGAL